MDAEAQLKSINRKIGRRLRMARKWRNLRLEDLAAQSHTTATTLENYETGVSRICADKLLQISLLLDLPIDYFFECLKPPDRKTVRP